MSKMSTKREVYKKSSLELDDRRESTIQKKYFKWVYENQEQYPQLKTIFHIPNGIHTANFGMIIHFKQLGLKSGVWDVYIPLYIAGSCGLWIEFKRKDVKKRLSKEQREFRELLFAHSEIRPVFVVVDSVEEAIKRTVDYLGLDYDYGRVRKENFSPVFDIKEDEDGKQD